MENTPSFSTSEELNPNSTTSSRFKNQPQNSWNSWPESINGLPTSLESYWW